MVLLKLRRLWKDGVQSDLWTGYTHVSLWRFIYSGEWSGMRGRVWIEQEGHPATRARSC